MTKIINVSDVYERLYNTYHETDAFAITITIGEDSYTVMNTLLFLSELQTNYYEMSYITHIDGEGGDISGFTTYWTLYKQHHIDEWTQILKSQLLEFDPRNTYHETRTYSPNITTANSGSYGRISANSGGTSSTVNHGKNTVGQTNTYDGTLRDSAKSTESGNTTTTNTDSTVNKSNGVETSKSHTSGTTTETKDGYNTNPYETMTAGIEFTARFDLGKLIMDGFSKECLFYDNGNGSDEKWQFPYM